MRYIFFLHRGTVNSKPRIDAAAEIIASYDFKKIIVTAAPDAPVMQSARQVAEKLGVPVTASVQAGFSYVGTTREKEAKTTFLFLCRTMREEHADAIVLVGNGPVVYHTALEAAEQWLSRDSFRGAFHFFKPGDLSMIDAQEKKTAFFRSEQP